MWWWNLRAELSYPSKHNSTSQSYHFVIVLLLSCVCLFDPMNCSMSGFSVFTISQSLLKFVFIESVMPSIHLILCHPLLLPSIFPSIMVFSNESALHIRWSNYWGSFNYNISSSNEYAGLISLRIAWFDLAVQGTLKSLLQQHTSKASILQFSAFFMVQLSYLYMTLK